MEVKKNLGKLSILSSPPCGQHAARGVLHLCQEHDISPHDNLETRKFSLCKAAAQMRGVDERIIPTLVYYFVSFKFNWGQGVLEGLIWYDIIYLSLVKLDITCKICSYLK